MSTLEKGTRAAIYCRVSSGRQEQDGYSLDTQLSRCREFAAEQGWSVAPDHVISETYSGYELRERPGMTRLRSLVRDCAVDVVLAYAIDRLSRKQVHVAVLVDEFESFSVKLAFVTESFDDSPIGELIQSVKSFAAEDERENLIERTGRG